MLSIFINSYYDSDVWCPYCGNLLHLPGDVRENAYYMGYLVTMKCPYCNEDIRIEYVEPEENDLYEQNHYQEWEYL